MASRIEIASFRLRQLRTILEIENASFPEEPYSEEMFRHFHAKCPELFLVARRARRIAGYIITCTQSKNAEIISIAVYPSHRKTGIGGAMLSHTIDRLTESGVTILELMVRSTSDEAISFYRGFGFKRLRKVPGYYQEGGDAVRMRKRL